MRARGRALDRRVVRAAYEEFLARGGVEPTRRLAEKENLWAVREGAKYGDVSGFARD